MSEHPRDVIIERVGSRFFVGYRDRSKMGMGVSSYAEARRWAQQMAATGSGRIIERTFVRAHASMKRTRFANSEPRVRFTLEPRLWPGGPGRQSHEEFRAEIKKLQKSLRGKAWRPKYKVGAYVLTSHGEHGRIVRLSPGNPDGYIVKMAKSRYYATGTDVFVPESMIRGHRRSPPDLGDRRRNTRGRFTRAR
jgi:hypothetical protein